MRASSNATASTWSSSRSRAARRSAKVMASGEIPVAVSAAAGVVDAALAGDDQVLLSGFQNP